MTATLPMNRKRDEVPRKYTCTVAIASTEQHGQCICGLPVRWAWDGKRPVLVLVHGRAIGVFGEVRSPDEKTPA